MSNLIVYSNSVSPVLDDINDFANTFVSVPNVSKLESPAYRGRIGEDILFMARLALTQEMHIQLRHQYPY